MLSSILHGFLHQHSCSCTEPHRALCSAMHLEHASSLIFSEGKHVGKRCFQLNTDTCKYAHEWLR